jgi:uncharacterized protein
MDHYVERILSILKRSDRIQIAFLFGSLARGAERPDSDVDIGIAGQSPLSAAEKLQLMDEFAVAFGRPIDLIDLRIASVPILRQVFTRGTCILKKDLGLYAFLLRKLWYDQADIMPNHDLILRHRRGKFMHG